MVRESSSCHSYSTDLSFNPKTKRASNIKSDKVDFSRIVEYLKQNVLTLDDVEPEPKSAISRKRIRVSLDPNAKTNFRPSKRQKLELPDDDEENIESREAVPILRHVFDIDLFHSNEPLSQASYNMEFTNLLKKICKREGKRRDRLEINLGTIYPHAVGYNTFACTANPLDSGRKKPIPETSLMEIPALVDNNNDTDFDYHSRSLQNILTCAYVLQMDKRALITGNLTINVQVADLLANKVKTQFPIKFSIEVAVSLLEPRIFKSIQTLKKKEEDLEEARRRILNYTFGIGHDVSSNGKGRTDVSFFLSCLQPAPQLLSNKAQNAMQPKELIPTLLPFQRRSVGWLLKREGTQVGSDGKLERMDTDTEQRSLFWEKVHPIPGKVWYVNRLTGSIVVEPPLDFLGGILAEEPGLGKTLESIALVMLTPEEKRNPSNSRWDPVGVIEVKEVKTTLIVTPSALAEQWVDELKLHSPSLKVLVYDGWKNVPVPITIQEARRMKLRLILQRRRHGDLGDDDYYIDDDEDSLSKDEIRELEETANQLTWCDFVHQYDICITTYNTLQQDLGVARAPIVRPRREVAKYREIYRDRSPLVMVEWRRVIMDEVQMVGGGKTEEMVSLIPRLSSFAVSGTPARATVDDLIHVIKFLRVDTLTESKKAWTRLLMPSFSCYFKRLFENISIRTIKAKVQDELTIPQQTRYVVPIELGKVERHVYDQTLEQALRFLGFDARGVTSSPSWQVDVNSLRTWVRRLRGICTHPQVGQLKQTDRLAKISAALKTIEEVHESMKDHNWRALMDERKCKVLIMLRRAQLIQHDDNNIQKYKVSLHLLQDALQAMNSICSEVKNSISENNAKIEELKREAASKSLKANGSESTTYRGKEREGDEALSDEELLKSAASEDHRIKKSALSLRYREVNIVLHQVYFRIGDTYSVLGDAYKEREEESYANAEQIRKELLKSTEQPALLSIEQLKGYSDNFVMIEQLPISAHGKSSKRSADLLLETNKIMEVLNAQANLLHEWRERTFKLLTENLSSNGDGNADGGEYARSLETQGEAETYLQALATLLADRREVLVLERTALATHDARERKARGTGVAKKAEGDVRVSDLEEIRPENEELQMELDKTRKAITAENNGRAIKSIISELQDIAHDNDESDSEKSLAKQWVTKLRALVKKQTSIHDKLESDLAQFRKAFNDRVSYFRQLQEISDSVAEVTWETTIVEEIEKTEAEEANCNKKINELQARGRFLNNLVENDEKEEEDRICVLCRCDFTRGFITHCAHVYCEGCLKEWIKRSDGKACPICRTLIIPEQLQRVSMKEKELETAKEDKKVEVPRSRRVIEYNTIDNDVLQKIQKIDCLGSFGSKIETLVKHILYLEDVDPGCKSIIFSAWADSLFILERALKENGIHCLRIDQKKGKGKGKSKENAVKLFKSNPKYRVLLLHGERENAGLNVTCASRVFLTESVVQHSFELQAIARIDRLGQTRPTEVYCYYAENTVEENILDLAAKHGRSLYTKDHAVGTVKVTPFEMDKKVSGDSQIKTNKKQKGQKGDFILRTDDMLAVLFPHLFEDVRYLLPEGESQGFGDFLSGDFDEDTDNMVIMDDSRRPIAGPSRLD